jgi:ABC-type transport system involved in multi-copper enzyme maturation permease subunit
MVVTDTECLDYRQWLFVGTADQMGALWWFLIAAACLALTALAAGYLLAAVRHGPMKAGDITYRVVIGGLREMFVISPRRVWALARLAVQESLRRRVWVAFLVFVVLLMFAGWFLDNEARDPAKLYLSFVFSISMLLVLALSLFLSVFSLPNDIKNKTIYTIVTKPVRSGEIVLGRVLGFTLIGTALLALMAVTSYFFVVRGLNHTHEIHVAELSEISGPDGPLGLTGDTTRDKFHRHEVVIDRDGRVTLKANVGHTHDVTVSEAGGETTYAVGRPRGLFRARVPVYGKLRFRDHTGKDVPRGINVGNEWTYRSYIEGGSPAACIWSFENVRAEDYPDGLPLELNIRVFRSYKGNIEEGILGSLQIKNPDTGRASAIHTFRARDFYIDTQFIPRKLTDTDGKPVDLFDDLTTPDGRVEVWLQCLNRAQYFGTAQADCYLRAEENLFELNFLKGYLSIWVQMVLVICFGVLFSTFLSGPVAMVATVGAVVIGFFAQFVIDLAMGNIVGGGPIESLIRMVTQMNVSVAFDPGIGIGIVKMIDKVLLFFMSAAAYLAPNYGRYSNTDYVAYGFDIPGDIVLQNLTACLAYVLGAFIAGYFLLRVREVAK